MGFRKWLLGIDPKELGKRLEKAAATTEALTEAAESEINHLHENLWRVERRINNRLVVVEQYCPDGSPHDKIYSPQLEGRPWICSKCGIQGNDQDESKRISANYEAVKRKFHPEKYGG